MIHFEPLDRLGNILHTTENQSCKSEEDLIAFFNYWNNHPFKKRIWIENNILLFESTYGNLVKLARIF